MPRSPRRVLSLTTVLTLVLCTAARAQRTAAPRVGPPRMPEASPGAGHSAESGAPGPGSVVDEKKLSTETGGIFDSLDDHDHFGSAIASLGDLDGDGVGDVAVGSPSDVNGGVVAGAVWVLFLNVDGTVRDFQKISTTEGGITGLSGGGFGISLASPGDLDGDGTCDLVVGAEGDDDGGPDSGAVWILLLNPDGTVGEQRKISSTQGGFTGPVGPGDFFGNAVAVLGDLDGNGTVDLAVGERLDDDGGLNAGAVWILLLNSDHTVLSEVKVTGGAGGFAGATELGDLFGTSVAGLGDLDGDGTPDLAVGAPGGNTEGIVWILFLAPDGTVSAHREISSVEGGFRGALDPFDRFGSAVANVGDLDLDGFTDLAVGAAGDDDGGGNFGDQGAVWVLFLKDGGTVAAERKISATQGGFVGPFEEADAFGTSVAGLGDLDGDGVPDVAVGAPGRNLTFHGDRGEIWLLFLNDDGTVEAERNVRDGVSGFPPSTLEPHDGFGRSVATIGDVDGDGIPELAVGAVGASDPGAVWILFPDETGNVRSLQKIDESAGGISPPGLLEPYLSFGIAIAPLGDFDGDGVPDVAVTALEEGGSGGTGSRLGRIFLLRLNRDGTVKQQTSIQVPRALLNEGDAVGFSLASLGDLDGDGVLDLIAGAPGDDDGGPSSSVNHGAVWILFLAPDGTLDGFQKISQTTGGLLATLPFRNEWGTSVANVGDVDGDGVTDVAVGSREDPGAGVADRGAVWILFLAPDGTAKGHVKINDVEGGFEGDLQDGDSFGAAVAAMGDLDGNGVPDLAVGAPGLSEGSVWILFLGSDGYVLDERRIGAGTGGFGSGLDPVDLFGSAVMALGDRDGDGAMDLAVGAIGDDDGGSGHGAVWLLSLDGVASLDFLTRDDPTSTPLVNGQDVSSPEEFGRTVLLSSSGPNVGPAIFDSTPLGPNDPSQDLDLLVSRDNLLVLQDPSALTQSTPGFFDRPNDAIAGGTLTFAFTRAPVELLSIDLVDIDPGANQEVTLTLFDGRGRTRTYDVPSGWTEDILVHGPPGVRTLDLTSTDPQAGFVATVTATEQPGFSPTEVTHISIQIAGSAAIDELTWDPHPEGAGRPRTVRLGEAAFRRRSSTPSATSTPTSTRAQTMRYTGSRP